MNMFLILKWKKTQGTKGQIMHLRLMYNKANKWGWKKNNRKIVQKYEVVTDPIFLGTATYWLEICVVFS